MQNDAKELICDVCEKNKAVGVCCVPMCPVSMAYCRECLNANAHPWCILVANTSCINGIQNANKEWRRMVADTCKHLGRTMKEFNAEVDEGIKQIKEMKDS